MRAIGRIVVGAMAVWAVAFGIACSSSNTPDVASSDATASDATELSPEDAAEEAAAAEAASPQDATSRDGTLPDDASPEASPSDAASDVAETSLVDAPLEASPRDGEVVDAEGGPSEGGPASGPVLVQSGSTLNIQGITNDGQVVYYDTSSQTYYAKPVSGGPPTLIYAVPPSSYYSYTREVANSVFVFDVASNYISLVTLWSANLPQPVTLTSAGLSTFYSAVWASNDGHHIAYLQVTGDGTIGAIYGANADGTNSTLLAGNIVTSSNATGRCFPLLVLSDHYAVASYCTVTDAGNAPTVEAFSVDNGWAPVAQVPQAIFTRTTFNTPTNPFYFPFALDPDGGTLIAAAASSDGGLLQSFAFDGGATVLDPTTNVVPGVALAGGLVGPAYAVYTSAGSVRQAYPSSAPQKLVDAGVLLMDALSPNGKWMLVSSGSNQRGLADISLISTLTPGPPLVVATTAQYNNLGLTVITTPGAAFTADNQYALVLTNLTQDSVGGTVYYVRSLGVAWPHAGRILSNGFAVDARPLTGSKVLVADNFQDSDGGTGSVPLIDFEVVDPSGNDPGTPLVTGVNANGNYAISADHKLVIYDVYSGSAPGIYAIAVP